MPGWQNRCTVFERERAQQEPIRVVLSFMQDVDADEALARLGLGD